GPRDRPIISTHMGLGRVHPRERSSSVKPLKPVRFLTAAIYAIAAAVCAMAGTSMAVWGAQIPEGPTFNRQVAPILFANCVSCHRPGDVAPMSLLSYQDARPWARAIKTKVAAREMPPWPADPPYGRFRNEHTLTDAQIDTLVAWVD